jgi:hypothetical protein
MVAVCPSRLVAGLHCRRHSRLQAWGVARHRLGQSKGAKAQVGVDLEAGVEGESAEEVGLARR